MIPADNRSLSRRALLRAAAAGLAVAAMPEAGALLSRAGGAVAPPADDSASPDLSRDLICLYLYTNDGVIRLEQVAPNRWGADSPILCNGGHWKCDGIHATLAGVECPWEAVYGATP